MAYKKQYNARGIKNKHRIRNRRKRYISRWNRIYINHITQFKKQQRMLYIQHQLIQKYGQ